MDEISKKELLQRSGISYGQLYRWKRERLIPEEWFVKRSAITGQETFFPKAQILDRVQAIVELKEDYSLEDIRRMLAAEHSVLLSRKRVEMLDALPKGLLDKVEALKGIEEFRRGEVAFLLLVCEVAHERKLKAAALHALLERTFPLMQQQRAGDVVCLLLDAAGTIYVAFTQGGELPTFDDGITLLRSAAIADLVANYQIGRVSADAEAD